ncbi:hypothetical protein ACH4FX_36450 [Streptomyces sp. NPDC018019]|uniref:hypothetical protein n=1 Tax=Streptomyces sp. NPDC018019 TaxID=3365030 RepID=UPI0037B9BD9E
MTHLSGGGVNGPLGYHLSLRPATERPQSRLTAFTQETFGGQPAHDRNGHLITAAHTGVVADGMKAGAHRGPQ